MWMHCLRCIRRMPIPFLEASKGKLASWRAWIGCAHLIESSRIEPHVITQACKEFVNKNGATGISTSKSPELLAKHADALLRKNNKLAEESDLEEALNQVVNIRHGLRYSHPPDNTASRWLSSNTLRTRMSSRPFTVQSFRNALFTECLRPRRRRRA